MIPHKRRALPVAERDGHGIRRETDHRREQQGDRMYEEPREETTCKRQAVQTTFPDKENINAFPPILKRDP